MSISSQLNNLIDSLTNTYNILSGMGATIPSNKNIQNLKPTIDSLPDTILRFKSLEERDSYTSKLNEGDICVVYNDDGNITETGQYSVIKTKDLATIPQTFEFDDSISDNIYTDSNGNTFLYIIFADSAENISEALYVHMVHITSESEVDRHNTVTENIAKSTRTITFNRIAISSTSDPIVLYPLPGGVGWTTESPVGYSEEHLVSAYRYTEENNSYEFSFSNPVHFIPNFLVDDGAIYTISWTDEICKIFSASTELIGFYKYISGSWVLITDGLTAEKEYVYNQPFYGINGVETGLLQRNTDLSNEELLFKSSVYNDISHLTTRYLDDFSYFFARNYSLLANDERLNLDTSYGIYMQSMFSYCYNLTSVPNFNTSNVTNMSDMFRVCYNLTSVPNFNTSNVINMVSMFCSCSNLTSVPNFNTSNVTNMVSMFDSCSNLTSVPNFNTSNVINMYYMFDSCSNLTTVPNFNTSNVINMYSMFYNCRNLTAVSNYNTTNVISMSYMFSNCENLTTVPNFNTSNVIDMSDMFYNCRNLTTVPNFNTSNVIKMDYMFSNCKNLTAVPNYNTTNVTDMLGMFYNSDKLTAVPQFNTSNVTNMYYMFNNCKNLTTVPNYNTTNVINMGYMFYNCYNLTEVPDLNTSNVEYMGRMFYNCRNLTAVPNFNTINVRDMYETFEFCTNIKTVPQFDIGNVTSMRWTFRNCYNLTAVPNLNTSNVTDMACTFDNCYNLTSITDIDTSNVTIASYMFSNCRNLTSLPNLNTSNTTQLDYMFYNCVNLTSVPSLILDKVYRITNVVYNCVNLSDLGGFINLGQGYNTSTNSLYGDLNLLSLSNLTEQSVSNVLTNLYTVSSQYNVYFSDNSITKIHLQDAYAAINNGWNIVNFILPIDLSYTYTNGITNNYIADSYLSNDEFRQVMYNFNNDGNIKNVAIHSLSNITNISELFINFTNLESVSLSDSQNIISVANIFTNCSNLSILDGFVNLGKAFTSDTAVIDRTLDFSTCPNLTNTSIVNVFSNLSRVSAESHINLGDTNFAKLTEDEIKVPCKKGWTVDGYIYTPESIESLGVINLSDSTNIASGSTPYAFEQAEDDEGTYYKNTNKNVNSSTAKMSIQITDAVIAMIGNTLILNCYYSSESADWDYLLIENGTTQIGKYGGYSEMNWYNVQVEIPIVAGDIVYISYIKDSSVSSGQDSVKIYIVQ